MIKKVRTEQLRVGVFVHDFNCIHRPKGNVFIDKSLIQSEKAIQIVQAWGIEEVYIDTAKGLNIKPGEGIIERRRAIDRKLHEQVLTSRPKAPEVPLWAELDIARSIKMDAVKTIKQAANAVANNTEIALDTAYDLIERMEQSVSRNRDALLLLMRIRKRDEYTLMHSISVSSLMLAFCNFCGMSHDTTINMAMGALLHDIGKIRIPDKILNKPAKLTPKEMEIIRRHTEYSAEAMARTKDLPYEAFDIALHHHERNDGNGYPHRLRGEAIHFAAKIASICDVFDALTSDRCYKPGISRVSGLRRLYEWRNGDFDQELIFKFISMIGVYPIGTYVRLENDLIGVVTGSSDDILQPVVRVFYDDRVKKPVKVSDIDLFSEGMKIDSYEFLEQWSPELQHLHRRLKPQLSQLHPPASR